MKYNLFLDDIRLPNKNYMFYLGESLSKYYESIDWIVVKNYKDFVETINKNGLPEIVSFDCDLQDIHYEIGLKSNFSEFNISDYDGFEKTGVHCALFIIDYCLDNNLDCPEYLIHSQNPAGANEIKMKLERFKQYRKTGK